MDEENTDADDESGYLSYIYGMMGTTTNWFHDPAESQEAITNSERAIGIEEETSLIFDDPDIVREEPSRCRAVIVKLLQNNQQPLAEDKAKRLFFGVTKLFASFDTNLRRLVYVILKDLMDVMCNEDFVVFATSVLLKDACTLDVIPFPAQHSILALSRIMDPVLLGAIRSVLIQRLISNGTTRPSAASCVLVSLSHFLSKYDACFLLNLATQPTSPVDIYTELLCLLEKALFSGTRVRQRTGMLQFHAVQLLCQLTIKDDKIQQLELCKLLMCIFHVLSPLARVVVVRFVANFLDYFQSIQGLSDDQHEQQTTTTTTAAITTAPIQTEGQQQEEGEKNADFLHDNNNKNNEIQACYSFLLSTMRNDDSVMVVYETAKIVCFLSCEQTVWFRLSRDQDHSAALDVIRRLCKSKVTRWPAARSAAKRTLALVDSNKRHAEPVG